MNQKQGRNFSGFLVGFVVIILLAFGVLIWAGLQPHVSPVDNLAEPQ